VDVYTSEKEQVEQIKKWWKENGKTLIAGLIMGFGALFGYRYWNDLKISRAESAWINYEHFLLVSAAGLSDEAVAAGNAIIEGDPKNTYAKLTALLLAKLAVEAKQLDEAKNRLQWVIDTSSEGEIRATAQARLARVLLAQNDAEGASALLGQIKHDSEIDRFAELRGDVFAAKGDTDQARTMYLQALEQAQKFGLNQDILQLKLDSLAPADG